MKHTLKSYSNLSDYLNDRLREAQDRNPKFSLRAWSRQLGFNNPSLLSDILSAKRRPSEKLLRKIATNLKLDERDETALITLSKQAKSELPRPPSNSNQHEVANDNLFDLDNFRIISDWHHLAILEAFLLRDFLPDPTKIARRLITNLTPSSVKVALKRLQRLGLLEIGVLGNLVRASKSKNLFIGKNIPSEAIRKHHVQTIQLALEAIDQQPLEIRDFSGSTVAIKQSDYEKVKIEILKLHRFINSLEASEGDADAIYRLNTQLFRLSKD